MKIAYNYRLFLAIFSYTHSGHFTQHTITLCLSADPQKIIPFIRALTLLSHLSRHASRVKSLALRLENCALPCPSRTKCRRRRHLVETCALSEKSRGAATAAHDDKFSYTAGLMSRPRPRGFQLSCNVVFVHIHRNLYRRSGFSHA